MPALILFACSDSDVRWIQGVSEAPLNDLPSSWTLALLFWPSAISERTQGQQIERSSSSILKSGTAPELQELLHCSLPKSARWWVRAQRACRLLSLQFYRLDSLQNSSRYVVCLPVLVCIAAFLPFLPREQPSSPHFPNNALQGNTCWYTRESSCCLCVGMSTDRTWR